MIKRRDHVLNRSRHFRSATARDRVGARPNSSNLGKAPGVLVLVEVVHRAIDDTDFVLVAGSPKQILDNSYDDDRIGEVGSRFARLYFGNQRLENRPDGVDLSPLRHDCG